MKTPWSLATIVCVTTCELKAQIVAGPITNQVSGHYYYLVGPTYWTNAEAQAVNLFGHLVTINDAAENSWVLSTFGDYGNLLIGFTDEGHEGQWVWTSGEPVTYTNWSAGEPNNGAGFFPYENRSMMYGSADPRAGTWNDIIGSVSDQQWFGVVEVVPEITIRVSQVEICWASVSGVVYQLQFRAALADSWADLGPQQPGTGVQMCETDPVAPGEPHRFYRVVTVP